MNWVELIPRIFEIFLFPLLGILTTYIVQLIRAKMEQLRENMNNEIFNKYNYLLSDTITTCVIAVNQTYVDSLKKQGKFDINAQKEAFRKVYEQVIEILKGDTLDYLQLAYSDLNGYITAQIEQQVREYKIEKLAVEKLAIEETEAVG